MREVVARRCFTASPEEHEEEITRPDLLKPFCPFCRGLGRRDFTQQLGSTIRLDCTNCAGTGRVQRRTHPGFER